MSEAVSIDLSGAKSNAWDDGELVRAYDAALEEFHIHHPGPGTWLDKVTAAATQGQPLAGAKSFGTEWYSHLDQRKRKRTEANPYAAPVVKRQTKKAASPAYAPPSPSPSRPEIDTPSRDQGDVPRTDANPPHQAPAMSIQSASHTTYDEAISYAMSAQYAAGYWLGVAHTKAASAVESNILHTRREFPEQKLKR